MKRCLLYSTPFLASLFAAIAVLSESGLRVPPNLRVSPPEARANMIASSTGSSWREVELAADGATLRAWYFQPHAWRGAAVVL